MMIGEIKRKRKDKNKNIKLKTIKICNEKLGIRESNKELTH